MPTTAISPTLKWDVLVTKRQGLTRDLPPGKEKWMWVPTSSTLIRCEWNVRPILLEKVLIDVEARAERFERGFQSFDGILLL